MAPYRIILIVVTVLSFLSIAGMREIRASLVVAIVIINVFGWSWPIIDKWNKRRNRLIADGEQELQVGNYGEAEKSLKLAAAEAESHGAPAARRSMILRSLAESQRKQDKLAEAEQTARRATVLLSDTTGQGRSQYGECLDVLADVYQDQGNYPQAQTILREALSLEESLPKPNPEMLAKRRQKLALAYHHAGDHAAAVPHFDRALELHVQAFGPEHAETGKVLTETGAALHKAGDHAEALLRLERALQIQEKTLGADAPEVTQGLYHLALAYEDSGHLDQAAVQYERILQLRRRQVVGNELELAEVFFYLARVYLMLNRLALAEEMAQSAIIIMELKPGPELASTLEILAKIYERSDRREEAAAASARARLVSNSVGGEPHDPMRQAPA
jgi:tetratricopeptide (TPR) repeat protein